MPNTNNITTAGRNKKKASTSTTSLNFEDYEFLFEKILDEEEARAIFKSYAQDVAHTAETFMFMDSVEQFKVLKNTGNRYILGREIIDKFIRPFSSYEINISGQDKKKLIDQFSSLCLEEDGIQEKTGAIVLPVDMFDTVYTHIITELKQEMFPRFKRSSHLRRFVKEKEKKQDYEFLHRIAKFNTNVERSVKPWYNLFSSSRASTESVTDVDLQVLDAIAVDSEQHWQVLEEGKVSQKQSFTTYRSSCKFAIYDDRINDCITDTQDKRSKGEVTSEVSKLKRSVGNRAYKVVGIMPYDIDGVMKTLVTPDFKARLDNSLGESYSVDYVPASQELHKYSYSVTLDHYPFPWPITCRDFVTMNTLVRKKVSSSDERYYFVRKSTEHERAPVRKGTVRAETFGGWILERTTSDSHQTKFTFVELTDYKFNDLTARYFEKVTKKRFNVMYVNLQKCLSDNEEAGFPEPTFSYGLMEALNDQMDRVKHLESKEVMGDGRLKRIAYLSRFRKSMSAQELQKIGEVSIRNNIKVNITGLLLCGGGVFYQVMEGRPEDIEEVYTRILKDDRHQDIHLVKEEFGLTERDRQFPTWSMNTVNLDDSDHYYSQFMKKLIERVSQMDSIASTSTDSREVEKLVDKILPDASRIFSKQLAVDCETSDESSETATTDSFDEWSLQS